MCFKTLLFLQYVVQLALFCHKSYSHHFERAGFLIKRRLLIILFYYLLNLIKIFKTKI
jgi:hypothetical protein